MPQTAVLAIGLDPRFADLGAMPGLTPERVRAYVEAEMDRVRALGYAVEMRLLAPGEAAEAELEALLGARRFDCVLLGARLREPRAPVVVRADSQPRPSPRARGAHRLQCRRPPTRPKRLGAGLRRNRAEERLTRRNCARGRGEGGARLRVERSRTADERAAAKIEAQQAMGVARYADPDALADAAGRVVAVRQP